MPKHVRKRSHAGLAAVLLAAALLSGCTSSAGGGPGSGPGSGPRDKPNFVFLLTDDLDTSATAYMPNLKALLTDQGTTLSRYYVSLAWCCPSRASTLRGQYAHNTGVWTNTAPNGGFFMFHQLGRERSTLATWLRGAGYRTGLFGKYLNGYPEQAPVKKTYVPPGWTTWVSPAAGYPYSQFDYTLNENGRLTHEKPSNATYLTDVLTRKADGFLAAKDTRPFLAYIAPYNPHIPATPAPRHRKLFAGVRAPRPPSYDEPDMAGKPAELQRLPPITGREAREWDALYRKRLQSMQSVDDMIGDLVQTLKDSGRLANTYFIFTSDNGFHIGQHRLAPGKNTAYEEDIRVPFVIRGPGIPAGRTVDALASNIDLGPMLADLAGAKTPEFADGRSLRPILTGGPPPKNWRQVLLLEHAKARGTHPIGPRTTVDGTLEPPEMVRAGVRTKAYLAPFVALRTRRYLYVEYETGEREMYDVVADPYELHDIAAGNPLLTGLSDRLRRLRECAGESCRAAEDGSEPAW
ncbi:sulfatase family protein [Actinomadura scrupuli]|uniref:sulfatase family protein n=1 Tax=Actinomadura scrupuli TaxID=559629 RepID=UPI003D9A00B3